MALINVNKQVLSKAHIRQNRCKVSIKLHILRERKKRKEKRKKGTGKDKQKP